MQFFFERFVQTTKNEQNEREVWNVKYAVQGVKNKLKSYIAQNIFDVRHHSIKVFFLGLLL